MSANSGPRFWWVMASEPASGWHWNKFFSHPNDYWEDWGGEEGIKAHRSQVLIREMRKGDVVLAYQAYEHNILGLILLGSNGKYHKTRKKWDTFDLNPKKFVKLKPAVKLQDIRERIPKAKDAIEFVGYRRPQGTVFEILPEGRDGILKLIFAHNPDMREEVAERLGLSRKIIPVPESGTDCGPYIETGEKESVTTHRIGQGRIRQAALERYGNQCCLCRIDNPSLLVAGHIKGWAKGEKARSNPKNVVLMCALHDSLFGKGFITLAPSNYKVRTATGALSKKAGNQVKHMTQKFRLPTTDPPGKEYLVWHGKNVFEGSL